MSRNYIGGLVAGKNVPDDFTINVDKCNDLIIVDRKYFLDYVGLIHAWAEKQES